MLGAVTVKKLPTDETFSLRGETLREAVHNDIKAGLIPFFVRINLDSHLHLNLQTRTHTFICTYKSLNV